MDGRRNIHKMNEPLVWTKAKPLVPGWYFVRAANYPARILFFEFTANFGAGGIEPTEGPRSTIGWEEFAGPILPPVDEKGGITKP